MRRNRDHAEMTAALLLQGMVMRGASPTDAGAQAAAISGAVQLIDALEMKWEKEDREEEARQRAADAAAAGSGETSSGANFSIGGRVGPGPGS